MSYDRYVLKKRRNQLGLTQQEVAEKAGINIKQYQRFETGERELTDASFMTTYQVLKALDMDAAKYAAGEYEIKELIYRGHDDRLYNYDTAEDTYTFKSDVLIGKALKPLAESVRGFERRSCYGASYPFTASWW